MKCYDGMGKVQERKDFGKFVRELNFDVEERGVGGSFFIFVELG